MALMGSLQPQLDLLNATSQAHGIMLALIRTTQMDNVHPSAVLALNALGSTLILNHHLINHAREVLSQNQPSYRIQQLQLQIGLSTRGVISEVQDSPAALKGFLLVTALRHTLDARHIGDLLYEMLNEAKQLDQIPVSKSQLKALVECLEPHCNRVLDSNAISELVTGPILTYVAGKGLTSTRALFATVDPQTEAKCILAAFEAIRNEDITQVEIRGVHASIHIASILWYLCGDQIQISCDDGHVLVRSAEPIAKVSLVLAVFESTPTAHLWKKTTWFKVDEVSEVFDADPDLQSTHFTNTLSLFVPRSEMYHWYRDEYLLKPASLNAAGILAAAFIKAACLFSYVTDESRSNNLQFGDICSEDILLDTRKTICTLGWPEDDINTELIDGITLCFAESDIDLGSSLQKNDEIVLLDRLNKQGTAGRLLSDKSIERSDHSTIFSIAVMVAESVLLRATQYGKTDIPRPDTSGKRNIEVVGRLLGGKRSNAIIASDYLRFAFASVHGVEKSKFVQPVIAVSDRGYVAHLYSIFKTPRTTAEAFAIAIQPGQIKWEDASMRVLYDAVERPSFTTCPDLTTYQAIDAKPGAASLFLGDMKPKFAIQTHTDSKSIYLRCQLPHATDQLCTFTRAVTNWALAYRPSASGKSKEQSIASEGGKIAHELELRHPKFSGLHTNPHFPHDTKGVTGYYSDDQANFMRFGTFDAEHLSCIIQGQASILDCIIYAHANVCSGWMILANP